MSLWKHPLENSEDRRQLAGPPGGLVRAQALGCPEALGQWARGGA